MTDSKRPKAPINDKTYVYNPQSFIKAEPGWNAVYTEDDGKMLLGIPIHFWALCTVRAVPQHKFDTEYPDGSRREELERQICGIVIGEVGFEVADSTSNFVGCVAPGRPLADAMSAEIIGCTEELYEPVVLTP